MTKEYVMYKGDKFIDLGTVEYLAKKYLKTKSALLYLSYPVRYKRSKGNDLLLYKIEDDDQVRN